MLEDKMIYTPDIDDGEHIKEVYAHAGLALYHAQCLETELINMLTMFKVSGLENVTRGDLDDLFENHRKKTLGGLLTLARKQVTFDSSAEATFEEALDNRNFLIHHFFFQNVRELATKDGRAKMLVDLQRLTQSFDAADNLASEITETLRQKLGVTDQRIKEAIAKDWGEDFAEKIFQPGN